MENIDLILGLMGAMAVLVAIARRINIPYPVLLVVGGLVISVIPQLPNVELAPELVFALFLPPIITSAGFYTPIRDFRFNIRSILLLAVGCVLFTAAVIALVAHSIIPGMSWAAAFALGAIVAPPDAVAATSVAERLNLPRRITTVLEGESLVNDASSLVTYRVAVAAVTAGTFSLGAAGLDFFVSSVGGVLVGLAMAWCINRLLLLLDDTPVEIVLTFLASFATYVLAEKVHGSGVLATVALGLYLGRHGVQTMSPQTRLEAQAVWAIIIFLLNGFVFILIGLQLSTVVNGLGTDSWGTLVWYAVALCGTLIVSRFVWVFPGTYLPRYVSAHIREREPYPPWQHIFVVSWAGMRGIVSLAAALSLPQDFPQRNLILFLAFCAILVTLVAQGLSLPLIVRWLGVEDDGGQQHEEDKARLVAAKAGLARLNQMTDGELIDGTDMNRIRQLYEARLQRFGARYHGDGDQAKEDRVSALTRVRSELIKAEEAALISLRDSDHINDEVMRVVQRDLDLEWLRLDTNRTENTKVM